MVHIKCNIFETISDQINFATWLAEAHSNRISLLVSASYVTKFARFESYKRITYKMYDRLLPGLDDFISRLDFVFDDFVFRDPLEAINIS